MDEQEKKRQRTLNRIKEAEEMIKKLHQDNPDVPRWKEEIEKMKNKMKEKEN